MEDNNGSGDYGGGIDGGGGIDQAHNTGAAKSDNNNSDISKRRKIEHGQHNPELMDQLSNVFDASSSYMMQVPLPRPLPFPTILQPDALMPYPPRPAPSAAAAPRMGINGQHAAFPTQNTSQQNFLNFSTPTTQFQQHQIQSLMAQQHAVLLQRSQQDQPHQQKVSQDATSTRPPSLPFPAGTSTPNTAPNNSAMLQFIIQQNQTLIAALARQQQDPTSSCAAPAAAHASPNDTSTGVAQQQQQRPASIQEQLSLMAAPQIGGRGQTVMAAFMPDMMMVQPGNRSYAVSSSVSTTGNASQSLLATSKAGGGGNIEGAALSGTVDHHSSNVASQRLVSGRRPVLLHMACDHDSLSEYQCLVRKQIELFEATQLDVESSAKGRNRPIVLGQVGIRCRHCTILLPKNRSRGATYFPAKLSGLYQAAQSMASGHLCSHCGHIPKDLRDELIVLRERKSSAGGGKKYWADGIRVLGVVEDENGLRFKYF